VAADPFALIAALADDSRLRVFAHVLLHGGTTAQVAVAAGLREKDTLKRLTMLESAGLVVHDEHGWRATTEALREAAAGAAAQRHAVDHGAGDPGVAAVLRVFMPEGRLEQIPAARNKRLIVLDHIARVFEPGVHYPEGEVTTLLTAFHPDYAALRRYLVDEGFLARAAGHYWRSGGTVDL
jgi:hypothetical protein